MAISYITTRRNARLQELATAVGNAGKLKIYSGTPPADANTALSGNTLLATPICGTPFEDTITGGVLTPLAITPAAIVATQTATFFRLTTSGDTVQAQGTVGATGSGADLEFPTVSFVTGVDCEVDSWTITEGNP